MSFGRRLQHMGRQQLGLLDDLLHALVDRRAADGQRAASVGAKPKGVPLVSECSISMSSYGDPQLVCDELGERRLVPLSVGQRAGRHRDFAGQIDPDLGTLPESSAPALTAQSDPLRGRDAADFGVG